MRRQARPERAGNSADEDGTRDFSAGSAPCHAAGEPSCDRLSGDDRSRCAPRECPDLGTPGIGGCRSERAAERDHPEDGMLTIKRRHNNARGRNTAVGQYLQGIAWAAFSDIDEFAFACFSDTRQQDRRDEEGEKHERCCPLSRTVDQRPDHERRERAAARERVGAVGEDRDDRGGDPADGEIAWVQAETASSSASSNPSIVNSSAVMSTRIPASRAVAAVIGPMHATVRDASTSVAFGTLWMKP